jgi:hypothetical protein
MQTAAAAQRPSLPHVSTVRTSRRVGRVLTAVLLFVMGLLLSIAPWFARDKQFLRLVGPVCFGLLFLVAAVMLVQEGLQVVTLSDSGIQARGPLWTKRARWEDVGSVRVKAVCNDRSRKMAAAGALGGALGGAIAGAMAGPERSLPTLFGDPTSDRRGFTPTANLHGRDGRKFFTFPTVLDWPFYDALVAEAAGRGIEIRGS